ncbi:MAG: HEAT repeat domain-containing protein [Verrucomicrobia bacterium]|nr:HEAT repeat domain-containing protein [Verrucomicrobiota bacterium]
MTNQPFTNAPLTAGVTLASLSTAAGKISLDEFISRIKSADDRVRGPAWQSAAEFGAPAVKPLAEVMAHPDFEIARAAQRALWKIVRHAGRPGADKERSEVATELVPLLAHGSSYVRREFVWMLSEIGGDDTVPPLAALLLDQDLREDVRGALQRMPGAKSLAALKTALASTPEDFKPAIAVSLRARGQKVNGFPSQKLIPTEKTAVKPVATA